MLRMNACARLLASVLVVSGLAGCASWPKQWGGKPCCIESKPVVRRAPIWWHLFDVTVLEPLETPFRLGRPLRKRLGLPVRAQNASDGAITATTFLEEDRGPETLAPEQVRWGPTRPDDLIKPPVVITKAKTEGKTAGFFVKDSRGEKYLLKLDPVATPELLSGAEVVASKLLYALGYRVPSYEAAMIPAGEFTIGEKPVAGLTQAKLEDLLAGRAKDGLVRVSASKLLKGDIIGPVPFKKFRDCSEVRALRLAYAWLNNIDTKDHNSLLVWDGTQTRAYLIDFGTSLGADAGAGGPKNPCAGWRHIVDLRESSLELLTLGLHPSACHFEHRPVSPAVGLYSAEFDPKRWKPYAPNSAFKEMDDEDARWIARRIRALSHAQIEAAVAAGQYSDPADAAYLVETLERRRRLIAEHYLEDELGDAEGDGD
jgi:hypothetical protein